MLALVLASALTAILFVYLFMPALWHAIMAIDEFDAHESSLTAVAAREPCSSLGVSHCLYLPPGNPFRESGPPANMAKLILLRQKVHQSCCIPRTFH